MLEFLMFLKGYHSVETLKMYFPNFIFSESVLGKDKNGGRKTFQRSAGVKK
jgi:hypothetical protein